MPHTAHVVKRIDDWISDAVLYRLNPPLSYFYFPAYNDETDQFGVPNRTTEYVIVSTVLDDDNYPDETLTFAANSAGEREHCHEVLGMSSRGDVGHAVALNYVDYKIVGKIPPLGPIQDEHRRRCAERLAARNASPSLGCCLSMTGPRS